MSEEAGKLGKWSTRACQSTPGNTQARRLTHPLVSHSSSHSLLVAPSSVQVVSVISTSRVDRVASNTSHKASDELLFLDGKGNTAL